MAIYVNLYGLNEGEQAEEYKSKKEKIRRDNEDYITGHALSRVKSGLGSKDNKKVYDFHNAKEENAERWSKAAAMADKATPDYYTSTSKAVNNVLARDAANRHMRRHPNAYKEMGIFAECRFFNEIDMSDVSKRREQFENNHNERMKELNKAISNLKSMHNGEEDKKSREKLDKIQNDLDDLLNSFK